MKQAWLLSSNIAPIGSPSWVGQDLGDVSALSEWVSFSPQVTLETGVGEFVKWYGQFYQI